MAADPCVSSHARAVAGSISRSWWDSTSTSRKTLTATCAERSARAAPSRHANAGPTICAPSTYRTGRIITAAAQQTIGLGKRIHDRHRPTHHAAVGDSVHTVGGRR
ncbi:hypothetical protein [Nocardia sp. NPDC003979]